jgi:flagellar protein FliS
MRSTSAADAYRSSSVESAPPIKIVHLLYEGAIRFIDQAARLDPNVDIEAFGSFLSRASAITSELRLSLDPEHAPELSEQLSALYLFVEDRITAARFERTAAPLAEARTILVKLLDGWKQIEVGASTQR